MRESDVSRMPGKRPLGGNLVLCVDVFQENLASCKCKSDTGKKRIHPKKLKSAFSPCYPGFTGFIKFFSKNNQTKAFCVAYREIYLIFPAIAANFL